MPIKVQAIGVFVAPANTPTKPIAASIPTGKGITPDSADPNVAPIKNRGVTSPPLKPQPSVKEVKSIFSAKS